ncbi:MAG TPA: M24 family metallopeptidase [Candidatus Hydrogenedentes bacterium]|nr:M24 family metallopeptidase [Candidatus Hydrogenedentota bacterium]
MTELRLFHARLALIQAFLRQQKHDGILLSRVDNFAMATGGKRNYVSTATDMGACSLFVTKDGKAFFMGNNIEATRVMAEELSCLECESRDFFWFDGSPAALVKKEFSGSFVSDDGSLGENVNGKLAYLRALLTFEELEKYRRLGKLAADAMTATINAIKPGQTEADIAALLAAEGARRRCLTPVILVAADERIMRYRHPLPVVSSLLPGGPDECPVKGYVMVVGGFMREGLVVSMTRFKRVGDLPKGIQGAHARICAVDALLHEATEPGRTLGDVFADCQRAYVDLGFDPDEWHRHHQGGATGYAGRTCKAAPGEPFPILDPQWRETVKGILDMDTPFGHAFAWNPSAPGVKSEDTFIMLPDGAKEIVTRTPALPNVELSSILGRPTAVAKSGIA